MTSRTVLKWLKKLLLKIDVWSPQRRAEDNACFVNICVHGIQVYKSRIGVDYIRNGQVNTTGTKQHSRKGLRFKTKQLKRYCI